MTYQLQYAGVIVEVSTEVATVTYSVTAYGAFALVNISATGGLSVIPIFGSTNNLGFALENSYTLSQHS